MQPDIWMRRRVPPPLMTVLQTAAFLFRHDAFVGSPSRNLTEVSRVRAGRSPIEPKGIDWSGCRVPPTDLRLPRPGLFCTSFTQVLARTRGFEPLFSAPVTDTRFVAGLGYVREGG